MPNFRDWGSFLTQSKPSISPRGGVLQGTLETPSYNEREARQREFIRDCCGDAEAQKLSFDERYGPGGSTIPKGTVTR